MYLNRKIVNEKISVNFTYQNKTKADDTKSHSKLYSLHRTTNHKTTKDSPKYKQQVHIKFRFNACD